MGNGKKPAEGWLKEKRFCPAFKVKAGDIDEDARRIRAVFNTPTKDRDGEIVYPRAFEKRIKGFLENPVLLWNHDPLSHTPIGRVEELTISDDKMEGYVVFRPKGDSSKADDVWSAFAKGFLNSSSIGFRVFEVNQSKGEDGQPGPLEIVDAELFEISAVAIPANPDALIQTEKALKVIRSTQGYAEAKTIYARPTDLDVLKHAKVLAEDVIRKQAAGESIPDEYLQAMELLRVSVIGATAESGFVGKDVEEALVDLEAKFDTGA
jgi:HK97 family phage prohead protease